MNDRSSQQVIPTVEPSYPTLITVARHGRAIGWIVAALTLLVIAGSNYRSLDVTVVVLALCGALVVKLIVQLVTDIARLLVDTLVPR